MKAVSLFELNEYLRRVIALNFPESIWIRAEIAQLNEKRGHIYIDLIEKDAQNDDIIAQSSAVVWQRTFRALLLKHGKVLQNVLQEGIEVLLKVNVTFHERFGISLSIEDIDLTYTLGKFALIRQQTLEYLQKKRLLDLQKKLLLPKVLQKIAIISSENAAGWKDFYEHIKENVYQYDIKLHLFDAAVQGQSAATEIASQLIRIKLLHAQNPFDAVVIIRGGGSKLDLIAFDDQTLNEAIAKFPIPILAGIGHEIDETVLDFTAHRSLKTPTAVAEFVIQHNLTFESNLLYQLQTAKSLLNHFFEKNNKFLDQIQKLVETETKLRLIKQKYQLDDVTKGLKNDIKRLVNSTFQNINIFENTAQQNDPQLIMKKGYSITLHKGKVITNSENISQNEELETILFEGKLKSVIK